MLRTQLFEGYPGKCCVRKTVSEERKDKICHIENTKQGTGAGLPEERHDKPGKSPGLARRRKAEEEPEKAPVINRR